jgi:hypothetical protein
MDDAQSGRVMDETALQQQLDAARQLRKQP